MSLYSVTAKTLTMIAILSMLAIPAIAGDKIQTGASKGAAKKHKKNYKTPCTGNCEDNSSRNLKNR